MLIYNKKPALSREEPLPGKTVPGKKELLDPIKSVFESIKRSFDRHVSPKMKKRAYFANDFLNHGKKIIHSTKAIKALLHPVSKTQKQVIIEWSTSKISKLLSLPLYLNNFYKHSKNFYKSDNARVEEALGMAEETSHVTSALSTACKGLKQLKIPALKSAAVASTAFLGISAIFSVGSIILNAKKAYKGFQFYKSLENVSDINDINKIIVDDEKGIIKTLEREFNVKKGAHLKTQLQAIWEKSRNANSKEEKDNLINKAKEALSNRVFKQTLSWGLKTLSQTISTVATGIILCAPPLAPIGFAMLATAALIDLTVVIVDFIEDRRFAKTINELASSNEQSPSLTIQRP